MSFLRKLVSISVRISYIIDRIIPLIAREDSYFDEIIQLVYELIKQAHYCAILEVGGIDRPLLSRSVNYRYDGLDIEHKPKCNKLYDNFYVQSVEEPIESKYDLIFSITVLEHVKSNDRAIGEIYNALKDGGSTIHYIPSKYHPYSIALRLIGNKWQKRLIKLLRPWAADVTGYETFFDKCSPKEMKRVFKKVGFNEIYSISFYRANDYFRFFFPIYILVSVWENICEKLKIEQLCSGFIIYGRK